MRSSVGLVVVGFFLGAVAVFFIAVLTGDTTYSTSSPSVVVAAPTSVLECESTPSAKSSSVTKPSSDESIVINPSTTTQPQQTLSRPQTIPPRQFTRKNFRAADLKFQAQCEEFIFGSGRGWSQLWQDWIIFQNIFANRSAVPGFYVDVGANNAYDMSNTFFFDRCLGWRGICVEPNPIFWSGYIDRTCSLVKKCISDVRRVVQFGASGRVVSSRGLSMECISLEELLDSFNVTKVDFLSLDVESHEIKVLEKFNFSKYEIDVFTVETFWVNTRIFDRIMHKGGYSKLTGIHIDDVYVRRPPLKYPPDWEKDEQENDQYRRLNLPGMLSNPTFPMPS